MNKINLLLKIVKILIGKWIFKNHKVGTRQLIASDDLGFNRICEISSFGSYGDYKGVDAYVDRAFWVDTLDDLTEAELEMLHDNHSLEIDEIRYDFLY